MPQRSRTKAIIFDFDGVLADTESLHAQTFLATLAEVGIHFSEEEYYKHFLGLPDKQSMVTAYERANRAFGAEDVEHLIGRKRILFSEVGVGAQLYPGVIDVLNRYSQDHALAIASGSFRDEIERVLQRHDIQHFFKTIVSAEDVSQGKPSPEPFLVAFRRLQNDYPDVVVEDCIVIEDSPLGIQAARLAGMRCIAIATNNSPDLLSAADKIFPSIAELDLS